MFDPIDFDPALVAVWPLEPVAATAAARSAAQALDGLLLETKAVLEPSAPEALQELLNEMTTEMRSQFELFRLIRSDAEAKLSGGDEAEAKIAKADIKAATDALSLIVRTIEKIDSLQRSLAHDREIAAEKDFDQATFEDMRADIERRIAERAEERAGRLMEERLAALAAGADPPGVAAVRPGDGEIETEPAPGNQGGAQQS